MGNLDMHMNARSDFSDMDNISQIPGSTTPLAPERPSTLPPRRILGLSLSTFILSSGLLLVAIAIALIAGLFGNRLATLEHSTEPLLRNMSMLQQLASGSTTGIPDLLLTPTTTPLTPSTSTSTGTGTGTGVGGYPNPFKTTTTSSGTTTTRTGGYQNAIPAPPPTDTSSSTSAFNYSPTQNTNSNTGGILSSEADVEIPGWKFQGCYHDHWTDRALSDGAGGEIRNDELMSNDQCRIECDGYRYFGTENGNLCFCGLATHVDLSMLRRAPDWKCNVQCAGVTMYSEACGGFSVLSLWMNVSGTGG